MTRTRTLYDSTNIADIPKSAKMVAAYSDGLYHGTLPAARARFPKARVVTITVSGQPGASVVDCETGDVTPPHAAKWARDEVAAGRTPTIYCNSSTWPTVKAEVAKFPLLRGKTVNYWIAHYDGDPTIPAGAVAKQYLGSPGNSPGHYDVSSVAAYWPGVDPDPKPSRHHIPPHVGAALFLLRRWLRKAHRKGWTLTPHAVERLKAASGEIKDVTK